MQIAQDDIVGRAIEISEGFFDRGDRVHLQTLGREAFIEKHADALFVVKNEDGAVLQKFGGRANGFAWDVPNVCRGGKGFGWLSNGDGQRDRESSASGGERFRFDISAVLANDGHADTETEAGAATGALGGVERIKDAREGFRPVADAIILDGDPDAVGVTREADLNAARVADLADGLFPIGNKIQKDLNELIGVADDGGKPGLRPEFHFDVVAAEGMFVQLEGALDETIDVERLLVRGRRARELEKILDDAR